MNLFLCNSRAYTGNEYITQTKTRTTNFATENHPEELPYPNVFWTDFYYYTKGFNPYSIYNNKFTNAWGSYYEYAYLEDYWIYWSDNFYTTPPFDPFNPEIPSVNQSIKALHLNTSGVDRIINHSITRGNTFYTFDFSFQIFHNITDIIFYGPDSVNHGDFAITFYGDLNIYLQVKFESINVGPEWYWEIYFYDDDFSVWRPINTNLLLHGQSNILLNIEYDSINKFVEFSTYTVWKNTTDNEYWTFSANERFYKSFIKNVTNQFDFLVTSITAMDIRITSMDCDRYPLGRGPDFENDPYFADIQFPEKWVNPLYYFDFFNQFETITLYQWVYDTFFQNTFSLAVSGWYYGFDILNVTCVFSLDKLGVIAISEVFSQIDNRYTYYDLTTIRNISKTFYQDNKTIDYRIRLESKRRITGSYNQTIVVYYYLHPYIPSETNEIVDSLGNAFPVIFIMFILPVSLTLMIRRSVEAISAKAIFLLLFALFSIVTYASGLIPLYALVFILIGIGIFILIDLKRGEK